MSRRTSLGDGPGTGRRTSVNQDHGTTKRRASVEHGSATAGGHRRHSVEDAIRSVRRGSVQDRMAANMAPQTGGRRVSVENSVKDRRASNAQGHAGRRQSNSQGSGRRGSTPSNASGDSKRDRSDSASSIGSDDLVTTDAISHHSSISGNDYEGLLVFV